MSVLITLLATFASASVFWGVDAEYSFNDGSIKGAAVEPRIIGGQKGFGDFTTVFNIYSENMELIKDCQGFEVKYTNQTTGRVTSVTITSAECFQDVQPDWKIEMTSNNISIRTLRYKIHPNFNNRTKDNNIGIFLPIPMAIYTNLPTLAAKNADFNNTTLSVLSWTQVSNDSTRLLSLPSKVINSMWCNLLYVLYPTKTTQLCISAWPFRGLEQDDVGAPLVYVDSENKYKIAGLVTSARSWTHRLSLPIQVTDIRPLVDWIQTETEHLME